MNIIYRHIRKICLKNIISGIIPLILCMLPLLVLPFSEVFFPKQVSYASELPEKYEGGSKYVEFSFPKLYYTGYNLISGNNIEGSYYYYIENEKALFVLVKGTSDTPEPVIYDYVCRGALTDWDKNIRNVLFEYAKDISFSPTGLTSVTFNVLLDETAYHLKLYTYLFIYTICIAIILGVFVLINLIIFSIPELHTSMDKFRRLTKRTQIHGVLQELDSGTHIGRTYLTEHYLISLLPNDVIVLPLDKLIWSYEHSRIHRFLWIKLRTSYTIHYICHHHIKLSASGYSKEELDAIMNHFANAFPEILLGYTQENKKTASKIH